jgi:DNA-binding Lrp family transcriptional regulator
MEPLDDLDRRLILTLTEHPRIGMLEVARRLGVARGTAQARLDKLLARGVITGFGPDLSLAGLGYTVVAFTTLEIAQGRGPEVVESLRAVPEVIEVHTTTGPGDLLCRIVARTNEDLHRVLDGLLHTPGITRTTTALALSNPVPMRLLPLVEAGI